MRIGTRGSALALAQAGHVAEFVEIDDGASSSRSPPAGTAGCRRQPGRGASRQVALGRHDRGRAARRRDRPRGALGQGRARRAGRGTGAAGRAGAGERRGRAVRRAWPRCPSRGRARRHQQPAPRRATAGGARGPAGGGDRRQRRHAPAAARRREARTAWTRSCSRAPGCSDWVARRRSARCSTPRASCPPPARACSRWRDARATRACEEAVAAITDADAFACLRAERALARALERELPHAARRPCGAGRLRLPEPARLGRAARRLGLGAATSCSAASTIPRRSDAGWRSGCRRPEPGSCCAGRRRWPLSTPEATPAQRA